MLRLFVTGTDTGVGKTRIAAALCTAYALRGKRVAAMKPVASGCRHTPAGLRSEDAEALMAATTVPAAYEDVNPYALEPAIAPHIAALEAGRAIDFRLLDACYERLSRASDVIVVEGAGGWLAPLDSTHTFADLALQWRLDVILVVGLRLGCLNHALLTAEAIRARGLDIAGWVGNSVDPNFERRDTNADFLRNRLAADCLGIFPYAPESGPRELSRIFESTLPE